MTSLLDDLGCILREPSEAHDDLRFIYGHWLPAARELRGCRRSVFDAFYPALAQRLLKRSGARTLVIATPESDTVHGFACGEPPDVLHFAYVPLKMRGVGLGREVITAVLEGYPDRIWVSTSPLSLPNHRRFVYNPYVLVT